MAEITVTEGRQVVASVDDSIILRLAENATTGYVWSITGLGDGLALLEDLPVPSQEPAPGAGGERVLRLRADQPGRWSVDLRLGREWEADPLESREVIVLVE